MRIKATNEGNLKLQSSDIFFAMLLIPLYFRDK